MARTLRGSQQEKLMIIKSEQVMLRYWSAYDENDSALIGPYNLVGTSSESKMVTLSCPIGGGPFELYLDNVESVGGE